MLPEEEAYKISQLTILFPEIEAEINRITESLKTISDVNTPTPSPVVKNRLMAQLNELKKAEQKVVPFSSYSEKKEESSLTIDRNDRKAKNKISWLAAASVIGLIVTVGFLTYVISQNEERKRELSFIKQQTDTLRSNLAAQQQQILAYNETIAMLHSDRFKKIELTSVPGKPSALAQVIWDTNTKIVYVADVSLPEAPSDKQYQLWAIVNGKPVDAGMLSDAKNLAQKMKVFEKAEMFAITLEQKGGSPVPTMEAMYVAGKV
jgi:hypothetical protein